MLLLFLGIGVVLWAGTLLWQGYIYSEPASQLYWRAPAAAGVLALFLTFWCFLDYRTPEGYNPTLMLFEPATSRAISFPKFVSVVKNQEVLYEAHKEKGHIHDYQDHNGKPWKPNTPDGPVQAIIVEEDGQRVRFNALPPKDGIVHYVEEGGKREMTDDYIGRIQMPRRGSLALTMILSVLHLGFWFVVLWLLLRYQWSHALGLAVIAWLVLTLTVMPILFRTAEERAHEAAKTAPVASVISPCQDPSAETPAPAPGVGEWRPRLRYVSVRSPGPGALALRPLPCSC
jgi:hypothetical protein